jgi:NTE family protein
MIVREFLETLHQKLAPAEEKDLGLTEVITRSWDTMQNTIARCQSALYTPDLVIEIPANACAFSEFHRTRELIELGRARAERVLAER